MNEPLITLARPEQISHPPTIALHMMVKNAESVIGRLLDCVGPYITDLFVVLNDTTDGTKRVLMEMRQKHHWRHAFLYEVDSDTHGSEQGPNSWYIHDVPATYEVGQPLVGEIYQGPFTGKDILANWAAARNTGWRLNSAVCDWRLFLDADDLVDDPHCLPGLCVELDRRGLDVAASRYHYRHTLNGHSMADAFRERLARGKGGRNIVWDGCVHERLVGYQPDTVAHVEGNLVVRDLRDSKGKDIRIPGRNLKVLYQKARASGWALSPREMLYLAAEARGCMPALANELLVRYLAVATWDAEKAWAATMLGEIAEAAEDHARAAVWYERSLSWHAGVLSAMRLARVRFKQEQWGAAVVAYERGIFNKRFPQHLDGGEVQEESIKILIVHCLCKLGRHAEAVTMVKEARASFPHIAALAELELQIQKEARRNSDDQG